MKRLVFAALLLSVLAFSAYASAEDPSYSFHKDYDGINLRAASVFYVETYDSDRDIIGMASGFVAFDEHVFVTNHHVIKDASYLKIWDEKQNAFVLDTVLISDGDTDLAILAFPDGKNYQSLEFELRAPLKRGEPVTTIGSPEGMQNTVAFGNISALPVIDGQQLIQFTAPISFGSSGGVLLNDSGKVIGITSSGITKGENIGFAIPADSLDALYRAWNEGTESALGAERPGNADASSFESSDGTNNNTGSNAGSDNNASITAPKAKTAPEATARPGEGRAQEPTKKPGTDNTNVSVSPGNGFDNSENVSGNAHNAAENTGTRLSAYFADTAYAEWESASNNRLKVHFEVSNQGSGKTIRSFELYVYAVDARGSRLYGQSDVYRWTTQKEIAPGRTVYSDYVTIPNRDEIAKIYCGIHQVTYTDGSTAAAGKVDYASWTYR